MWSLSLIGYPYLSGIREGLYFNNIHQKDTCYDEFGVCAPNMDSTLGSKVNIISRACVIA